MSGEQDGRLEIMAALAAGEYAVTDHIDSDQSRLWFGEVGAVWEQHRYHGRPRTHCSLKLIERARDLPLAITTWATNPIPVQEPEVYQARALVAETQAAVAALSTGQWFWTDATWGLVHHERLGVCNFRLKDNRFMLLSQNHRPLERISAALGKPDGISVGLSWPGTELARQHAAAAADVLETLDAVRVGTHVLGHATPSGVRGYTMVGGLLLWIELDESLRITEELLFNPWVAIFDEQHLLKKVLANSHAGGRPKRLFPLPPIPPEELRALAAALALPREAIVQRYLARLKAGGRLSGGPTSDQSWTIRWTETGYRISSYQDDGEGLRPVTRPMTEERIREMLISYHMYGLYQMPLSPG